MKKTILTLCAGLCVMHAAWATIEDDIKIIQKAYEDFKRDRRQDKSIDNDATKFFHFNQTNEKAKNHLNKLTTVNKDSNLIRYLYNNVPGRKEEDKLQYPSTGGFFGIGQETNQKTLEDNFLGDLKKFPRNNTLFTTKENAIKTLKNNFLINIYFNLYQFFYIEKTDTPFNEFINKNPLKALSDELKVNEEIIKNVTEKSTQEIDDLLKKEKEEKIKKQQEEEEKNIHNFGSALKNIA